MDKKIKKQKMAKKTATTITAPAAWIVNSSDRGRKSIKKGKVYLQDKEEFVIELYNPLQNCVLADIKLNGNSISKSGLVLNPGQRFYLDCFIDDKKKFIFNTYEVDDTDETQQAIAKNGLLEVFFYKESVVTLENWNDKFNRILTGRTYPYWTSYPWGGVYYGTGITTGGVCNTTTTGNFNLTNLNTTTSNAYYSNTMPINASYTSNVSLTSAIGGNTRSIETGRIEKGQKSQQKFESIDMDFDKYYIASTILQILPESRRPIETKEIKFNSNTGTIEVKVPKGLSKDSISKINEIISEFDCEKDKLLSLLEVILGFYTRQNMDWEFETKENRDKIDDKIKSVELLKKLGELHKAGILTEEEFTTKKAELLSKI